MIIGSITPPPSTGLFFKTPSPDIVPQISANGNVSDALLALYKMARYYDVYSVQVSRSEMELSRSYILEQIEFLLLYTKKKPRFVLHNKAPKYCLTIHISPVILHYYGNGRRNTGDWHFKDGFIAFRDIADLYMKHRRGRLLTIITDCHSSGQWVMECAKFLDEQGVKPCGHSARKKGILLKVLASCQPGQDSAELAYTTQGMYLGEDGHIRRPFKTKQLRAEQHMFGVDFTKFRCGKKEEEKCSIASDATWSTAGEVIDHPNFIGNIM